MIQQMDLKFLSGPADFPRDPIFLKRCARHAFRRMMDEDEPGSAKLGRPADKGRRPKAALRRAPFAEPIDSEQVEIAIEKERQERAFEVWRQRSDIFDGRTPARDF